MMKAKSMNDQDFDKIMIDGVNVIETVSNEECETVAQSWALKPCNTSNSKEDGLVDNYFSVHLSYEDHRNIENNSTLDFQLNKELDFLEIQMDVFKKLEKHDNINPMSYDCVMDVIAISCEFLLENIIGNLLLC
ncbi:unnamed protein product [Amaranthus hypochondriacus]